MADTDYRTQAPENYNNEEDVCWICLEGGDNLVTPCGCPRVAHPQCLAKWQLHKAGTTEETHCRFCNHELESWKTKLFNGPKKNANSRPVMRFCLNGQVYYIVPKPGSDGLAEFKDTVRKLCNLQEDTQLDLSFQCSDPTEGSQLNLEGDGAYDAAVHCATVWADTRGTELPSDVIDTSDPAAVDRYRQTNSSGNRQTSTSLPDVESPSGSSRSLGSILRRTVSTPDANGMDAPASDEPTSRIRLPNIFRGIKDRFTVITSRALPVLRSNSGS